ncbi:MAG TPA: methyltransferase domain-containing protein [Mycobacteriales bacterium]|nr:methyltransferase domain-containing protein [Mycobacteriales bacterium]
MPDRPRSLVFDAIADRYDATRGGTERAQRFAAAIAEYLPSPPPPSGRSAEAVVELGVGTGAVAAALGEFGFDVLGIDLSRPMLQRAQARLGSRVALADAQQLPLGSGSLPLLYSAWLLHLVADVRAVLAEVARVLTPGGRYVVICSEPHPVKPDDVTVLLARLWHDLEPRGRSDRPDRLTALAPSAGLAVTARSQLCSEPRPVTPDEAAQRVEERTFSVLWDVDERRWEQAVQPVIAALRALPDPARARLGADSYEVLVLERA